jgi:hypothetical protein
MRACRSAASAVPRSSAEPRCRRTQRRRTPGSRSRRRAREASCSAPAEAYVSRASSSGATVSRGRSAAASRARSSSAEDRTSGRPIPSSRCRASRTHASSSSNGFPVRANGGRLAAFGEAPVLLLTSTSAKSGLRQTSPMTYREHAPAEQVQQGRAHTRGDALRPLPHRTGTQWIWHVRARWHRPGAPTLRAVTVTNSHSAAPRNCGGRRPRHQTHGAPQQEDA